MSDNKPIQRIYALEMSNYIRPEIKEVRGKKWVLNGDKNKFYQDIIDAYNGSTTNSAIIDSYSQFIYGKGLTTKGDQAQLQQVKDIFSKNDLRRICKDFEMFGEASIEVKYLNGKVRKGFHVPKQRIAPEVADENGNIKGYWYSYDFSDTMKYKPIRFDAFGFGDKSNVGQRSEIYVIKDYQIGQFYYSNPSYISGLSWAKFEEEFQNYCINHIKNGLSAGHIININGGVPASEIEAEAAIAKIDNKLAGSNNSGKRLVVFNDGKENEATISAIEVSEAHKQYEYLCAEARQQIMTAHKLTSPMLVGVKEASGFSSNAEEIKVGFAELMINVITPKQEIILDDLMNICKVNGITTELEFESLRSEQPQAQPTQMASVKICCSSHDKENIELSTAADELIELGEVIDTETWEEIDEIELTQSDTINEYTLSLAKTFSSFPNASSEQDTELFKVRYEYSGASTGQRDFCNKLLNAGKVYRKEDIDLAGSKVVNKGFGPNGADTYNIWLYKGGVNCKHFWLRKIYLKKNNTSLTVNEARKLILELDPKDRPKAKWQENDPLVAQPAQDSNNNFRLN